ncbi:MAG: ribulose-phosphate 3-epimerase [Gemmatimonadota bacterium]|nr:ribulose-phosphate 3-epimerase [Gemmatimonadota bacterium]
MTIRIAPSVLSADLGRLREQLDQVVDGGADWIHVDVMDGRFVPNLTFGAPMIRALRKLTDLPLDVHLMVVEPERYIDEYADAGANVFTFHVEATTHCQRHLTAIRERGMQAGIALNPSTSLRAVEEIIPDLDLLLIMSVNPGFGGQKYWSGSNRKLSEARRMLSARNSDATLEVDGGIALDTIAAAWQSGADTFVAGTAVFGTADPVEAVRELRLRCSVAV